MIITEIAHTAYLYELQIIACPFSADKYSEDFYLVRK